MLEAKAPLSIDNFDACDYIFLNHAHPDHYLNIKEFVDKFHPPISVDSLYAAELSRTIGIELAYIFPVDRTQLPLPGLEGVNALIIPPPDNVRGGGLYD